MDVKRKEFIASVLYSNQILKNIYINSRYRKEIKYTLKESVAPKEDKTKSILFFTTHKCGSMYVGKVIKELLSTESSLEFIDLVTYRIAKGADILSKGTIVGAAEDIKDQTLGKEIMLQPNGYFFGPFRNPEFAKLALGDLDDFKILLMLRDPRNVLTSLFYSIRDTHITPFASIPRREQFISERKELQRIGIDDFVLQYCDLWVKRYQDYCEQILHRSNTLFVKFEDMADSHSEWLDQISEFLELHETQKLQLSINQKARRQIAKSDFKKKLSPDTAEYLTKSFQPVLKELNYIV